MSEFDLDREWEGVVTNDGDKGEGEEENEEDDDEDSGRARGEPTTSEAVLSALGDVLLE